MNPQFPLYIVSKGRADSRLTSRALETMGVPYFIIIEEQEYSDYSSVINKDKILILDKTFQDHYETFDALGNSKSKGPGAARNFAWEHSKKLGADYHWVMDDNILCFRRFHLNDQPKVSDGTIFKCMEDFVLRYSNIGMAGPNYYMFVPRKKRVPPFVVNTRIYSCNLIKNNLPFKWRGRYNEDTDLSLCILKSGLCTVQFNAFLQQKMPTQVIKGGNTADFYSKEGTLPKSKMLVQMHPDVAILKYKFNRWHHQVNYRPFRKNKLKRKVSTEALPLVDDYGMKLITKEEVNKNA